MEFSWFKGHSTGMDFVLLPDHDGTAHGDLSAEFVTSLCDRRTGLGADGVLRVIRSTAAGHNSPAEWFMDQRNADGSPAGSCGNGVRVFARHLHEQGLVEGTDFSVHTRNGLKFVSLADDRVTVDRGAYRVGRHTPVDVEGRQWSALEVNTGSPHAVVLVDSVAQAGALSRAPGHDSHLFPEGVTIEFVERRSDGWISMRVHDNGLGEIPSCDAGAGAAAVALGINEDAALPASYRVDAPGGTLHVRVEHDRIMLTGPAEIVAGGRMERYA